MARTIIRINVWGNERAPFGIAQHLRRSYERLYTLDELRAHLRTLSDNADMIRLHRGVTTVSVNADDRHVMQVGGYDARRGLYCDVY